MRDVFVTDEHFVAFGDDGTVLASREGREWRDVSLPIDADLSSGLAFNERWLVSGVNAGIWVSEDFGQTWREADLPSQAGDTFVPSDIEIQDNGSLISVGHWGSPMAWCNTAVAVSTTGLEWSHASDTSLPFITQAISRFDGGLITRSFFGGPPCSVMPIMPGSALFYAVGDTGSGFDSGTMFANVPPASIGEGLAWHRDALWITGRNFMGLPAEYGHWVRRIVPPQTADDVPSIELQRDALSLAAFREGVVVSHQGHVSFVDETGSVVEQSLPETDRFYAFAARGDLLVGVGLDGGAIRGTPPNPIAVTATRPETLAMLALLLACFGLGVLSLRVRGA
jgi:hypothetical protein